MPEGHTLHRLARDLDRDFTGTVVRASSPQGRFPDATRVSGRVLTRTEAIGKHLLLHFRGGLVTHVHLGLFGRFRKRRNPPPEPRPTTRLRLEGERSTWDLSGPTCCELLTPAGLRRLRARIGADPLAPDADPSSALGRIQRSRRAIGALLLDQTLFAGIGNVYRAELLFLGGIHPLTPGRALTETQLLSIWTTARDLLAKGVDARRIVTVSHPAGVRALRAEALFVYRRRACRVCQGPIWRSVVGARAIYACERCQPPLADDAAGVQAVNGSSGKSSVTTARARSARVRRWGPRCPGRSTWSA